MHRFIRKKLSCWIRHLPKMVHDLNCGFIIKAWISLLPFHLATFLTLKWFLLISSFTDYWAGIIFSQINLLMFFKAELAPYKKNNSTTLNKFCLNHIYLLNGSVYIENNLAFEFIYASKHFYRGGNNLGQNTIRRQSQTDEWSKQRIRGKSNGKKRMRYKRSVEKWEKKNVNIIGI